LTEVEFRNQVGVHARRPTSRSARQYREPGTFSNGSHNHVQAHRHHRVRATQETVYMTHDETARDTVQSLVAEVAHGRLTRRDALARGAAAGIALPALLGLAGTGIAAAQDATPNPDAKPGGTLRVGLQADPAELDPHLTSLTAAWHVIEHVYEGLLTVDTTLAPIPALAESHEVSEDGLTYTFNLRQGVTFVNSPRMTRSTASAGSWIRQPPHHRPATSPRSLRSKHPMPRPRW
jgi:hypothetical protein